MPKTIKQIADELGVSKQAVRKEIAKQGLQVSGNPIQIEVDIEKRIKSAFFRRKTATSNQQPTEQGFKEVVALLRDELKAKDQQIEQLNARLAETTAALVAAQETARAAQALHAGTIKQQLTSGSEQEGPGGWLRKIFRKDKP